MTARTVQAGGGEWRFAPDVPSPATAGRSQAILQARLLDEVTGEPPPLPIAAATGVHGARARVAAGGRVGVVGQPSVAFFAPAIATAHADLSVDAPGFLPLRLDAPIGPQPGYPDAFTPADLGDVALHRRPVRVYGRVLSRTTGPLAGATVTVTGVWPMLVHPPGPAALPNAMPALAGLYADRPGGGTLRRRNFSPAAEVKQLVRPAVAGDRVVRLSDSDAIAAGQVLAIEFGDPERIELIGIAAIDPGSSDDQPASFSLDHALRSDHAEGATAARAVPAGAGAANAIVRPARRGDVTIWTAALAGIGPATHSIEIDGGPELPEFHQSQRYEAVSGAGGDYALPPIHRLAAFELTVAHAGQPTPILRVVTPAWDAVTQLEDFIFP